ncbi:SOS response-associated peptidase [Patescibacteria group bacterium]
MCGRFAQGDTDAIYSKYRVKISESLRKKIHPRYNIAPFQIVPVVTQDEDKKNKLELMRWGFIPYWAKDVKIGYKLINARSETIFEKPSFKRSAKSKRCIVPATGFYEWKHAGNSKIPYFVKPSKDSLFSLAGLFDEWMDPEGKKVKTFTILTTEPNKVLKPIHKRMPVVLEKNEEEPWIGKRVQDTDLLESLFDPYPVRHMNVYEVSREVNSPSNDKESFTQPLKK